MRQSTIEVHITRTEVALSPPTAISVQLGAITGPRGPAGADGASGDGSALVALAAHVASATPHPAYDTDLQDLTILLENALA